MARGGSRPGAGRPRLTDAEKAQRAEARKANRKAARKPVKGKKAAAAKRAKALEKPAAVAVAPDGVKKAGAPQNWPFGAQPEQPPAAEPPAAPAAEEEPDEPVIAADTPLGFLLEVVKETRLKLSVRIQCAALAAPFVHAKPAPLGKKEERAGAAKKVGQGRFAAAAAPLALVKR